MLIASLASVAALIFSALTSDISHLVPSPCDFGESYQVSMVRCSSSFSNTGDRPVQVTAGAVLRGDKIEPTVAIIAPGTTAYFDLTSNVEHDVGQAEHFFYVTSAGGDSPKRYTKAAGFVLPITDEASPTIDFGVVNDSDAALREMPLSLSSRDTSDFRITAIIDKPEFVDARLSADKATLSVRLRADVPWGPVDEFVKLETNTRKQLFVYVRIKANVHGEVVPSDNPFDLGLVRKGETNEARIRLTSRSGNIFEIGKIELEGLSGDAQVIPCQTGENGCRVVRFILSSAQPTGAINGRLIIALPEYGKRLPISLKGLVIERDAVIKDLSKISQEHLRSSKQAEVSRLADALKRAAAPSEPEVPGHGPLLKWSVANEQLLFGYVVYRAEAADGPYLRISDTIIPARKEDETGSNYQWRDVTAKSGTTYWYYVDAVRNNGTRQNLSDPQKVVAK